MIYDNLENYKMYCRLNASFEKAFEFITKAVKDDYCAGNYDIDGKEIYAFIHEYDTKPKSLCSFEGHKKYIDIQCVMHGCEVMGSVPVSRTELIGEYNSEKDVSFYETNDDCTYCVVSEGDFCIFYPEDIHRPSIAYNDNPSNVKKLVVKVHL